MWFTIAAYDDADVVSVEKIAALRDYTMFLLKMTVHLEFNLGEILIKWDFQRNDTFVTDWRHCYNNGRCRVIEYSNSVKERTKELGERALYCHSQ